MSGENNTRKFTNANGPLSGDDLLHAVRLDMNSLFELVRSLDAKVDARLHDTRPMWETVLARFDGIEEQLKSQGAELKGHGARFDVIGAELRRLRRKIERIVGNSATTSLKCESISRISRTGLRNPKRHQLDLTLDSDARVD